MRQADDHAARDASRVVLVHGSLYTAAAAAPVLVMVFVTPVVTRLLGQAQYGVVATSMLVVQIGLIVLSFGMAEAITRHGILEGSGIPGARALVLRGGALSLAVTAVLVATGRWWAPALTGGEWQPAIVVAAVGAFLFGVITNVQAVQRALGRPGPFVLLSMIATFGGPVLGLVAVLALTRDAAHYVTGLVGGYAVAAVVALWILRRQGRSQAHPGDLRRALVVGAPMIAHQSSLYLATAVLVVVATHAEGLAGGGRLQLALLVGTAPAVVAMAMGNSWAPAVYRARPEDRASVITVTARDVLALVAILAGGVSLLAPWGLAYLAPPEYLPAELVPAVALAAAGSVLAVPYLANVHLVFAVGRSAGIVLLAPVAVVVAAVALVALGDGRPLWALGAGLPLAYVAMVVLASVLRRRTTDVAFHERALAPWTALGLVSCAAGALLPADDAASAVRVLPAAALAALALWRLRSVLRHSPATVGADA